MGRADDAHVYRLRLATDRHHLALLQHAQQAGLQSQWHVANLVQQQGATIGLQQLAAHAFLACTGKAAAAVAEQFALDQAFRDRGAVDGDERLAAPLAGLVHGLGKSLLATAGLAAQQQRHIALEHPHAAAEVVLQGGVEQADKRLHFPRGPRLGGWHRPHRCASLATQAGEHLAPVQGMQRPRRAAARRGAAEQFVVAASEKAFQRFAQHATTHRAQQVQRALVGGADAPVTVERQQAFAEQADRLGLQVKTQQPLLFEMAQEVAAFDHLRRQVDQSHGVELALPGNVGPRRRHIQHCQQLAMRVEHRAGRAGQAGVATAEVLVLVNGQRLALDQAGADAVGALARLAPVSAQPQPGTLEAAPLGRRADAIEDHPAGIGQQHRMAGPGKLLVQAVHFMVGNLQHLAQALAAFQQAPMLEHHRGLDHRRVEVVVLQAA